MNFTVQSEVGQLRQAIVHRPGLELSRLTPRNVGELLFDDVMWAKQAKEEHDAFAETLRDKGVRVHYFGQLLGETLELPEGRAFVLDRLCTPELLGPTLVTPLRKLFDDLDGSALATYLVGGVLKADLHPGRTRSLKWDMLRKDDFVLPPLPNHLFQRDNSCWIYGGVSVNPMAKPARQRETPAQSGHLPLPPDVRQRRLHLVLRRRRRQPPAGQRRRRRRARARQRRRDDRHGRADHPDGRRDPHRRPVHDGTGPDGHRRRAARSPGP